MPKTIFKTTRSSTFFFADWPNGVTRISDELMRSKANGYISRVMLLVSRLLEFDEKFECEPNGAFS